MKVIYSCLLILLASCASTSDTENIKIVDKPSGNCEMVATLSSLGFNILPPVANMIAKSGLRRKAKEYGVDQIVVTKKEGTFEVNMDAEGYSCN